MNRFNTSRPLMFLLTTFLLSVSISFGQPAGQAKPAMRIQKREQGFASRPAVKTGTVEAGPSLPRRNGMVLIPGGTFLMGSNHGERDEAPVHQVRVKDFWIDEHEVTVAEFARFVKAKHHVTAAENHTSSKAFLKSAGGFIPVPGATWKFPDGPDGPRAPDYEPVTQVSWEDAHAYARWADKRLPTEAEWEYAARGGLSQAEYSWGADLRPSGSCVANWWQGDFPHSNSLEDGYVTRAPVGQFPANGYGLHDVTGNVWEWVADWYDPQYFQKSPSRWPKGPATGKERVVRGGSFLCAENVCTAYRVSARSKHIPTTGLNNIGFRCARDKK